MSSVVTNVVIAWRINPTDGRTAAAESVLASGLPVPPTVTAALVDPDGSVDVGESVGPVEAESVALVEALGAGVESVDVPVADVPSVLAGALVEAGAEPVGPEADDESLGVSAAGDGVSVGLGAAVVLAGAAAVDAGGVPKPLLPAACAPPMNAVNHTMVVTTIVARARGARARGGWPCST
jgi:hypothetical protein